MLVWAKAYVVATESLHGVALLSNSQTSLLVTLETIFLDFAVKLVPGAPSRPLRGVQCSGRFKSVPLSLQIDTRLVTMSRITGLYSTSRRLAYHLDVHDRLVHFARVIHSLGEVSRSRQRQQLEKSAGDLHVGGWRQAFRRYTGSLPPTLEKTPESHRRCRSKCFEGRDIVLMYIPTAADSKTLYTLPHPADASAETNAGEWKSLAKIASACLLEGDCCTKAMISCGPSQFALALCQGCC